MVSDWRSCPHKFFRRHVQGYTKDRVNVHLHFGGCFAKGLEVARKTYFELADPTVNAKYHTATTPQRCAEAAQVALVEAANAVIAEWGVFEAPPAPTRSESAKTLNACLVALHEYFKEWPLDDPELRTHVHEGKPCVEFSFALPIPGSTHPDTGEPILYAGRFDLIADFQHSVWGLDDKTTSVDPNSDYWRAQWRLRSQFTGYCWGAREYGMTLRGFIVRGIGVMKTDIKHGFALVPRPPFLIDRWLRQLQDDVNAMCSQYCDLHKRGITVQGVDMFADVYGHPFSQRFDNACADFGGCSYIDLCSAENPDAWLSEYIVKKWNPLERDDA